MKEFKGKRYSINKKYRLISEKLKEEYGIDLSPQTMRRHHLDTIRNGVVKFNIGDGKQVELRRK